MKIPNDAPVEVSPVEAKTFNDLWINTISISVPSESQGRITVELNPYNYETKEILKDEVISITTNDLWSAVMEVPEVALAMGHIIAAIEPLKNWIKLKENPPIPEPEPEEDGVTP